MADHPGGVLELDEHIEGATVREVKEETGLAVTTQGISGIYKNMKIGVVAIGTGHVAIRHHDGSYLLDANQALPGHGS